MRNKNNLFVGITSWNSSPFLGHCIDAIKRTTGDVRPRIVVLDNESTDGSAELAQAHGAEVVKRRCSQPQALNHLFDLSRSDFTLLIHADVILLSKIWFEVSAAHFTKNVALLSPEDIGCGPYTRPWGKGMPESSFMLFRTDLARSARQWFRQQRFKIRWPYRAINFFGDHITYNLPSMLERRGLTWRMMQVHTSTKEDNPIYTPNFRPKYWDESWGHYRYGLGNFYSLDGHVTHYHNWFDRTAADSLNIDSASKDTFPKDGGLPLAYVSAYTRRLLADLDNSTIVIPEVGEPVRNLNSHVQA